MQNRNPNDMQIGGQHYREENPSFQHWDLVAHYRMNYFIGNMTKYVSRWRKKDPLNDLEKAMHYLDKLIFLTLHGQLMPTDIELNANLSVAREFCKSQQLDDLETEIILHSVAYFYPSDLMYIHSLLEKLIDRFKASV